MELKNAEIEMIEKKLEKVFKHILKTYKANDLVNWVNRDHLLKLKCVNEFLIKEKFTIEDIEMFIEDKTENIIRKSDKMVVTPSLKLDFLLEATSIDDLIARIFEGGYKVKHFDYYKEKNRTSLGYYISLDDLSKKQFDSMHPFYRLHYNCNKKISKIFLGDTNASDYENSKAEIRLYLFEALKIVFYGEKNDKLEKSLQINSLDDIKSIIKSQNKSKRLCNYIVTIVENKARKRSEQKDNPDFYYDSTKQKYEAIYYNYLDNTDYMTKDEVGRDVINKTWIDLDKKSEIISEENKTGEFTTYIFENYINSEVLTKFQLKFVSTFLMYETNSDGAIYDNENNQLYTKQHVYKMKQEIKKRLIKKIKEDEIINEKENGRLFLDWEVI